MKIQVLHNEDGHAKKVAVPEAQQVIKSEQANRLEADYDADAEPEAVIKARQEAVVKARSVSLNSLAAALDAAELQRKTYLNS
jgi:2-methylisocitrate lyase-like PEP mutase family enzyme